VRTPVSALALIAENAVADLASDLQDKGALRLVLAFYCILEHEKREHVLSLAQRYAAETKSATHESARTYSIFRDIQ
jgi:hypothetical protein